MSKSTIRWGIILAVLAIATYIYQGPWQDYARKKTGPKNFFAGVEWNKISNIEITKNQTTTILEKNNDSLKVSGTKDFYVKEGQVNKIKEILGEASSKDLNLVSSNEESKKEYNTDSENGIKVTIKQDNSEALNIIVGRQAFDLDGVYVSPSYTSNTYITNAKLFLAFDVAEWRDTTIFKNDQNKIDKIRFQYPDREFTLEKKDNKWIDAENNKFVASSTLVDLVVKNMTDLSAYSIPTQTFQGTDLEKNLIIIQATGGDINNTLMIGAATSSPENYGPNSFKNYFAKKSSSDNIYLIGEDIKESLDKKIGDFK